MLLDDSYNASPESTIAALNLLDDIDAEKRVAVLGDMLELGPFEHQGHISVGTRARHVVDLLVTVGELGSLIAEGALNAGMTKSEIIECRDSNHALNYLSNNIGMVTVSTFSSYCVACCVGRISRRTNLARDTRRSSGTRWTGTIASLCSPRPTRKHVVR
jgi:hypothetical protein